MVLPLSYFGSISSRPVLFDSIYCTGSEEKILDCSHASIGNHFCSEDRLSNVAIQCKGKCFQS